MSSNQVLALLLGAALATAALPMATTQQQQQPSAEEMQKMMEKAKKWTSPGPEHKKLEPLLGKWDVDSRIGGAPAGKSKAEFSWQLEGRWLKEEVTGQLMAMPYKGFGLLGYDNFKQAYVATWIDGLNTYKLDSQGKFDQTGKTLILYGTMDEYLTGENDKMVKYVYRWKDNDHFNFEIHDLAIGEPNTLVVDMTYVRSK